MEEKKEELEDCILVLSDILDVMYNKELVSYQKLSQKEFLNWQEYERSWKYLDIECDLFKNSHLTNLGNKKKPRLTSAGKQVILDK